MKQTSICAQCAECSHMKEGTCPGLLTYWRPDCPQWYTTKLVPDLYGKDVLVRAAPGRLT